MEYGSANCCEFSLLQMSPAYRRMVPHLQNGKRPIHSSTVAVKVMIAITATAITFQDGLVMICSRPFASCVVEATRLFISAAVKVVDLLPLPVLSRRVG